MRPFVTAGIPDKYRPFAGVNKTRGSVGSLRHSRKSDEEDYGSRNKRSQV